jgi:hypothetical protein
MNSTITSVCFRIRPLDAGYAERIRTTLLDDFGNRLKIQTGVAAPCRFCLRIARTDEPLIVFAHRPFASVGPYAEIGPVFIHALACDGYADAGCFPPDFVQRCLTMRAYNSEGTIETAELSTPGDPEASLARLFVNDRVSFVHVRNPAWGCYDFQVEKA